MISLFHSSYLAEWDIEHCTHIALENHVSGASTWDLDLNLLDSLHLKCKWFHIISDDGGLNMSSGMKASWTSSKVIIFIFTGMEVPLHEGCTNHDWQSNDMAEGKKLFKKDLLNGKCSYQWYSDGIDKSKIVFTFYIQ